MLSTEPDFLSDFCIAGINYRKSDIVIRGNFSLTPEQCHQLLEDVKAENIPSGFVISTCNRTEVYGIGNPLDVVKLLCKHTNGTQENFIQHGYIKQGPQAIEHLFKVAAGLDSQIIGDYEILSQIKQAARTAKLHGCINGFTERLINYVLQASKAIKTNTHLSSGTVSVAYAAIEIIKEKITDLKDKKILLVGTGKFGTNIADNINTYLPGIQLSVTNRTNEKAQFLAAQSNAAFIAYENLAAAADDSDIIVVSSSANNYTITPAHFNKQKNRLLLDLSVPQNIDPAVKEIKGIELFNVDEISLVLNATITKRQAEIPKALTIINESIAEMTQWYEMQGNSSLLKKVKAQLHELSNGNTVALSKKETIQKTVSSLAIQLKTENNKGCQYINALSSYLHKEP